MSGATTLPRTGATEVAEQQIDRRTGLSHKELLHDYILASRPVVLTDAVKDWPALGKWTPAFFRARYGHLTFRTRPDAPELTLREQIDRMKVSTAADPAPYPCSFSVTDTFPELLDDLRPQLVLGRSDRTVSPMLPKGLLGGTTVHELFFGGTGGTFPVLHYDQLGMNTQITQLHGHKEFHLFAPDQTPFLYPRTDNPLISGVNSIFDPDLERFPLFAQARKHVVMLGPGDTMYFPSGWWHTTRIEGESITYGRAVLNAVNWNAFMRESYRHWKRVHPMIALPAFAFGHLLGAVMSLGEIGG